MRTERQGETQIHDQASFKTSKRRNEPLAQSGLELEQQEDHLVNERDDDSQLTYRRMRAPVHARRTKLLRGAGPMAGSLSRLRGPSHDQSCCAKVFCATQVCTKYDSSHVATWLHNCNWVLRAIVFGSHVLNINITLALECSPEKAKKTKAQTILDERMV
jgi:hypothetical protein